MSTMDDYDKLIELMYDIWSVTVPYAKQKWKARDMAVAKQAWELRERKMFGKSSKILIFKNYYAGSSIQFLDILFTNTGDLDILYEDPRLLVKTHPVSTTDCNDRVLFCLESPPGTHPGYYKLR